jgi:hypothetical protein
MFPFDLRYKHRKQKETKMAFLTDKIWALEIGPQRRLEA